MAIFKIVPDVNSQVLCNKKDGVCIETPYGSTIYRDVGKVELYRMKTKQRNSLHINIFNNNMDDVGDYRWNENVGNCIINEDDESLSIVFSNK